MNLLLASGRSKRIRSSWYYLGSGDDRFDRMAMHICQAEVSSLVLKG